MDKSDPLWIYSPNREPIEIDIMSDIYESKPKKFAMRVWKHKKDPLAQFMIQQAERKAMEALNLPKIE